MIEVTTTSQNYSYLQFANSRQIYNNKESISKTSHTQVDYLEISVQSLKARSAVENIINHIDGIYHAAESHNTPSYNTQSHNNSKENLRSFYATAKESVDEGFANLKNNNSKDENLLKSAYQQTIKELKDWYHNGGKPREKVDYTSVKVEAVSIEYSITSFTEKSLSQLAK